jgi:hypothetical protein
MLSWSDDFDGKFGAAGNDWFVIPIDLPVGSLCRTQSLVVTNTFGERTLIRPAHQAGRIFHPFPFFPFGYPFRAISFGHNLATQL